MSPSRSTTRTRISLASGAGAQRSPLGVIGAVALHAAIVAATLFTWQHRLDIAQESAPVVPVDLVTIAAKTNITPAVRQAPQLDQKPMPQIKPEKLKLPAPSLPPQQSEAAPPTQAASEPLIKAPPPPIVPKPRPEDSRQKSKFDVDNVLALLNKVAPAPAAIPRHAKVADVPHKGFGAENAMTMDLRDSLKNQIEQCWSPPAGAPHAEDLVVFFNLSLNPDGSVSRPPQLTGQSATSVAGNPFMRAAADAARRAIYVCAPYKLPPDRYADWRDSTIEFDPRDVVGQ